MNKIGLLSRRRTERDRQSDDVSNAHFAAARGSDKPPTSENFTIFHTVRTGMVIKLRFLILFLTIGFCGRHESRELAATVAGMIDRGGENRGLPLYPFGRQTLRRSGGTRRRDAENGNGVTKRREEKKTGEKKKKKRKKKFCGKTPR